MQEKESKNLAESKVQKITRITITIISIICCLPLATCWFLTSDRDLMQWILYIVYLIALVLLNICLWVKPKKRK